MSTVVTRFAPSPTGSLHIGSLRTALFNWLWARKHKGTFILRIEDTDQSRKVAGAVEEIINALKWYGLDIDEGPVQQSDRRDIYQRYATELVEKGQAYFSFETPEELEKLREVQRLNSTPIKYNALSVASLSDDEIQTKLHAGESHVIRLKVPYEGVTEFNDLVYGTVKVENARIDDQVLVKSDSFPTYHLANVVDDYNMKITHVIRGEEWLPSTPKHVLLYQALGWAVPTFCHLPLILGPDKSKLSKRHGAAAALDYREMGYLPEAILNFIALLGWNPKSDQELFPLPELIKEFDLTKINKSSAVFDVEKLNWMNGKYIRQMDDGQYVGGCEPYLPQSFIEASQDQQQTKDVVLLFKDRLENFKDIAVAVEKVFSEKPLTDATLLIPKGGTAPETLSALEKAHQLVSECADEKFNADDLKEMFIAFIKEQRLTNKAVLWPLRVAITGEERSPGVFEYMAAIGKQLSLTKIDNALQLLKSN